MHIRDVCRPSKKEGYTRFPVIQSLNWMHRLDPSTMPTFDGCARARGPPLLDELHTRGTKLRRIYLPFHLKLMSIPALRFRRDCNTRALRMDA